MESAREILRVGLTGGIASGKTTVAQILAEHGAFVLDGDRLAHEVMSPGGVVHQAVVERFGREILGESGSIDRARLGARVFHDSADREALNSIVHPAVLAELERQIASYTGHSKVAVFDAALLVETGAYREFHKLIVANCSAATQIRRLFARDGMALEEAERRIAAQASLAEKLAVADYVVDTEGTLRETRAEVSAIYVRLLADFEERFSRRT